MTPAYNRKRRATAEEIISNHAAEFRLTHGREPKWLPVAGAPGFVQWVLNPATVCLDEALQEDPSEVDEVYG